MKTKASWDGVERLVELARRVHKLTVEDNCAAIASYDQIAAAWREKIASNGLPLDERTAFTMMLTLQSLFDAIEGARDTSLSEEEATLFQMRLTSVATAICTAFEL